jgi:vitamin B12/bleomycin/antimicrobial peptide transport system ATP-binding/permease protein
MTTIDPAAQEAPTLALDRRVIMAFARLSSGFWRGEHSRRAWTITLALILFLSLSIGATLALNHWNRWFFDALEKKNAAVLGQAVLVLGLIIGSMAAVGVGIVRSRETLQVRWREWVTRELVDRWIDRQRFYHMGLLRTEPANPEYRISDDTRWATELLVDCGIGLFLAVISASAFIGILWSVGGSLDVNAGGFAFTIPAYMVVAALLYGVIASGLMLRVGRPLVGSVVRKNEAEGHFRFALMRVRDNAESIALSRGANDEKRFANGLYDTNVQRWLAIVRQHGNLTWITNASGPLVPIFPLLVALPKYLSGDLTLGQVMQLAAAFVQVQVAISWIVDNYNKIADWYASARRIIELTDAAEAIDTRLAAADKIAPRLALTAGTSPGLRLDHVSVCDPTGADLVRNVTFAALPGEHVIVSGMSGSGKTSLIRAVAGLWPWGRGTITRDPRTALFVVPQRPYVPTTTLRNALRYPNGTGVIEDKAYTAALRRAGLANLQHRLDETVRWDHALSNGEMQRLSIARVLVQRPDIVLLDEALGALEETNRRELMLCLRQDLPATAIVSFTQMPQPGCDFDTRITLEAAGSSAAHEQDMDNPAARKLVPA